MQDRRHAPPCMYSVSRRKPWKGVDTRVHRDPNHKHTYMFIALLRHIDSKRSLFGSETKLLR